MSKLKYILLNTFSFSVLFSRLLTLCSFPCHNQEYNDESGNPIWKNRVESWKDRKNKKKKVANKSVKEAPVPQEQQMEEKQL